MAIYIHDEAAQLRLRVTGDLDEEAARQLASCYTTAASVVSGRKTVLDLTALTAAHDSAVQLLEALHHEGIEFLAQSDFQKRLVARVTGAPLADDRAERGVGKWLRGMLGPARI